MTECLVSKAKKECKCERCIIERKIERIRDDFRKGILSFEELLEEGQKMMNESVREIKKHVRRKR